MGVSLTRADLHLGVSRDGEIFVTSRQDGMIRMLVPDDAPAGELDAWLALEKDDPIAKTSRFHRMRVATASGDHALTRVLDEVIARGGKNVLIVPASACADGATMHALAASVRAYEDRMTVNWRPGLGGLQ